MKIAYIQISNIMSFPFHESVEEAPKITFDDGVNILIGENGAGKSTVLEIINFVFRNAIFCRALFDPLKYGNRFNLSTLERQDILNLSKESNVNIYRLAANWNSEDQAQTIRLKLELDEIDRENLEILIKNKASLETLAACYSKIEPFDFINTQQSYELLIQLNHRRNVFTCHFSSVDGGSNYLVNYNLFNELIRLHNREKTENSIRPLYEPFALIGGYRNYNVFSPSMTMQEEGGVQLQEILQKEFRLSANQSEVSEPIIFNIVRFRLAEKHYETFVLSGMEAAEERANNDAFLKLINAKLAIIGLKLMITLKNESSWEYAFKLEDIENGREVTDINSLSAGQKSIMHLIFEAYGRGEFKGGVLIIDEPEIHLHHQFQQEYLRIIEALNFEQKSQYILVTHSETLISSETIGKVKRFHRDAQKNTLFYDPQITEKHRMLVKILDNTRSAYAFFARKVVLVEGDTDRYFFRSVFNALYPELKQEVAILDIGGKANFHSWRAFFESFGLQVYVIGDFDNVTASTLQGDPIISADENRLIDDELRENQLSEINETEQEMLKSSFQKLTEDELFLIKPSWRLWRPVVQFIKQKVRISGRVRTERIKQKMPTIGDKIKEKYKNRVYILSKGDLESYTGTRGKTLDELVPFCEGIQDWLKTDSLEAKEIRNICAMITLDT